MSFTGHTLFRQSCTHYQVTIMFPLWGLNSVKMNLYSMLGLVLPAVLDLCSLDMQQIL